MSITRDTLLKEIAAGMDQRNDVDVKSHDFAEEAILVSEQHAVAVGLTGLDREEAIFELGFVLSDATEREARKGNYSAGFALLAEEALRWLEREGAVKLP